MTIRKGAKFRHKAIDNISILKVCQVTKFVTVRLVRKLLQSQMLGAIVVVSVMALNPPIEDTNESSPAQAEEEAVQTPTIPAVQAAWEEYTNHIKKWFYRPDLEAVRITLAVATSHFHKDCDPIWLFILGPSSSSKTVVCINSLLDLPQVKMMGDITAKTFLSGYTGTAHPSLLHQIGNGILAFKDFTTFMSKRPEEQSEISSQLREIYDGAFCKHTGKGIPIAWKGKLTVIAAATPALERAWSSRRDLGERFLQVRMSRVDGVSQSEYAQRQRGFEEHISTRMKELARTFFQLTPPITNPPPKLSNSQMTRVASMAELISHCRGAVPRHPITNAIIDLPQIEGSGRMAKALASLISNHAALFRRTAITEDDMTIGKRVALNSIPSTRSLIIDSIPITGSIGSDVLQLQTGLPESTVAYLTGDLEALGILKVQHNEIVANQITLTSQVQKWWMAAFAPVAVAQPVQPQPAREAVH